MNQMTKPSPHPYHDVMINTNDYSVTLCINVENGHSIFDYWRVDKDGHKRVGSILGSHTKNDYWQDCVDLKVIQNVFKVLDFYTNVCENEEEDNLVNFTADDIPF